MTAVFPTASPVGIIKLEIAGQRLHFEIASRDRIGAEPGRFHAINANHVIWTETGRVFESSASVEPPGFVRP